MIHLQGISFDLGYNIISNIYVFCRKLFVGGLSWETTQGVYILRRNVMLVLITALTVKKQYICSTG